MITRNMVFLSHANPEDNRFVSWLAARLYAVGYEIWSDLTHLHGGERHWDDIETTIRHHAAIVVVVLSQSSYNKPGVLDEIGLAAKVGRQLKRRVFLLPIIIDDLSYDDIPIQLTNINTISFANDWAVGLSRLLRALGANNIPCLSPRSEKAEPWESFRPVSLTADHSAYELLTSNRFKIIRHPSSVNLVRLLSPQQFIDRIPSELTIPSVRHHRLLVTLEENVENLAALVPHESAIEPGYQIPWTQFVKKGGFGISPHQARVIVTQLLNQGFGKLASKIGLAEVDIGRSKGWFVSTATPGGGRAKYIDWANDGRWRALRGFSQRYGRHWHTAIRSRFQVRSPMFMEAQLHIFFSRDGMSLVRGPAEQRIRRTFCKSWWNDRWRDLYHAFGALLGAGEREFCPLVSSTDSLSVSVSPSPMLLSMPRSTVIRGWAVPASNVDVGTYNDDMPSDGDEEVKSNGFWQHADLQRVDFIPEPTVLVGFGQEVEHPRDGLFLFGPVDAMANPREMRVGVIGTNQGIDLFRTAHQALRGFIPAPEPQVAHRDDWPGFEAVFGADWKLPFVSMITIPEQELSHKIRIENRHEAVFETVGAFAERIARHRREEEVTPDFWIVAIPDELYKLGRPRSTVAVVERVRSTYPFDEKAGRRILAEGSLFSEDVEAAKLYLHEINFHNQLKARLLQPAGIVCQVIRESTLTAISDRDGVVGRREMEDAATIAWNLSTASFVKAGGRPWQVSQVRPGVCYLGLVFKHDQSDRSGRYACCGAQMFLTSGDGMVFRGAVGPWYSVERGEFHLSRVAAKDLLTTVLTAYRREHGGYPQELFIHGRTRFDEEEWRGFREAVPKGTKLVGIRIAAWRGLRTFTCGRRAVTRGTMIRESHTSGYLWTRGFIPRLKTYPGWETPLPLFIDVHRGNTELFTVMEDVLALTKLNFNNCVFGDGLPVTLRFADAVGEILTAAPLEDLPPLPFKHYI